jgi:hypothetical protein
LLKNKLNSVKNIMWTGLVFGYLSASAQPTIPSAVATSFAKQFPDASSVKWGMENSREYEADFKSKGIKMSANYDLRGNWKETETSVRPKDLPPQIIKAIANRYPGSVIRAADELERPAGKLIFEADIKTGAIKKEVELFADGRFVK